MQAGKKKIRRLLPNADALIILSSAFAGILFLSPIYPQCKSSKSQVTVKLMETADQGFCLCALCFDAKMSPDCLFSLQAVDAEHLKIQFLSSEAQVHIRQCLSFCLYPDRIISHVCNMLRDFSSCFVSVPHYKIHLLLFVRL